VEHLKKAVQADPSLPPAVLLAAYLHMADGRMPAAQRALEFAGANHKEHPEIYLAFGRVALLENRSTDAWVHFEKALKTTPPEAWNQQRRSLFQLDCLAGMATVAERREDWPSAVKVYERWAGLAPKDTTVLLRWARALLGAGQSDAAFEKFAAAKKLDPSMQPPELSMAALFIEQGKFAPAAVWYEKAAANYPDDGRVFFEYASALMISGDAAGATAQIDKAMQAPSHGAEIRNDLLLLRGYLARSQRKYEEAEQIFSEILGNSPGHFQALSQLPLVLVEQADEQKRQRALQLALILSQKHPRSPHSWSTLGGVQYRLGRLADAEVSLAKALAAMPGDGDSLYVLAQVLLEQGKTQEAEKVVQQLRTAAARPGPFVQRADAQGWIKNVAVAFP
jgi:tetratricopeptide (TPR) repeat protein